MTEKELRRLYRLFDAECARASDKIRNAREYEPYLFVPTTAAKGEGLRAFDDLLAKASGLPAPDEVLSLLKSHFIEYLMGKKSALESAFEAPGTFVGGITRFVGFISRKDSRFAEERAEILLRRIGQVDELWAGIRSLLSSTRPSRLKELAGSCDNLAVVCSICRSKAVESFAGLPDARVAAIVQALDSLSLKSTAWGDEVRKALDSDALIAGSNDIRAVDAGTPGVPDIENYRLALKEERGVALDDLLKWHEEEVAKTREEMYDIGSRIASVSVPRTVTGVVDALNKYAGPAKTAEEMFSRCKDYLARAREGTRGYVNMPEEVCRVVPMEEEGRAHNPWGGYRGGCPRRRPLLGEMVLNPDNVPAITDGWIKINAVHESYPGHHVQFVRASYDPLPETVREGARSTPLQEGTALRSERVFEFVFPEDQFYPLFVAYRRHHTAVRIKADLYLHYFHRPAEDAVDLYVEELAFDRKTARGQVLAQELQPGYFVCYYYGLKRITDLQHKYGYDDKSYTEMLFAPSRVSLEGFEAFLGLSEADKKRFLTQFPSILEQG